MKEAFNFMFKDNMFKKKVLTYFIVTFIAALLSNIANTMVPEPNTLPSIQYVILFILGSVIMLIPNGYGVSCIKSIIEQDENIVLPFLNIKNNFVLGFKLAIAIIIMTLVFGISIALVAIVFAIISSLLNVQGIGAICLGIFLTLLTIIVLYYILALCYIFATTEKFTSFLRFKYATQLIKNDIKKYTLSVLLFIALMILVGIISAIVAVIFAALGIVGMVVYTVISTLIGSYMVYVVSYINAKAIKA